MRPINEIAAEICTLAGHINAANHRWLVLIAEFDRRTGWSDGATQSCAHWLNWKCGMAMGAAREKVRVARALENLPKISAAMATGMLSYSKAREITRVAEPATEDYLLMIAEHGTAAHVEKLVRAYRRCQDAEELSREAHQQQARCVSIRHDDDGSLVLNCRLPAAIGSRSWFMWPKRLCEIEPRDAANSKMALRWPRRPRVDSPATQAWSSCSKTMTANRST